MYLGYERGQGDKGFSALSGTKSIRYVMAFDFRIKLGMLYLNNSFDAYHVSTFFGTVCHCLCFFLPLIHSQLVFLFQGPT